MKINAGQAPSTLVPKYIGSDYDKVKSVADNIEAVTEVADNLDHINTVESNLENIVTVVDNITDVATVSDNIGYVKDVAEGIEGLPVTSYIGDEPPTQPSNGAEWYCTTDGRTYVWYTDVDSGQWVESSPQSVIETDPSTAHTVAINTDNIFALWKRSAAEAGLNLVAGSFEEGGVLTSSTDVLLHKESKSIYVWSGTFSHNVVKGTNPTVPGSGYVPRTDVVLRNQIGVIAKRFNGIDDLSSDTSIVVGDRVSTGLTEWKVTASATPLSYGANYLVPVSDVFLIDWSVAVDGSVLADDDLTQAIACADAAGVWCIIPNGSILIREVPHGADSRIKGYAHRGTNLLIDDNVSHNRGLYYERPTVAECGVQLENITFKAKTSGIGYGWTMKRVAFAKSKNIRFVNLARGENFYDVLISRFVEHYYKSCAAGSYNYGDAGANINVYEHPISRNCPDTYVIEGNSANDNASYGTKWIDGDFEYNQRVFNISAKGQSAHVAENCTFEGDSASAATRNEVRVMSGATLDIVNPKLGDISSSPSPALLTSDSTGALNLKGPIGKQTSAFRVRVPKAGRYDGGSELRDGNLSNLPSNTADVVIHNRVHSSFCSAATSSIAGFIAGVVSAGVKRVSGFDSTSGWSSGAGTLVSDPIGGNTAFEVTTQARMACTIPTTGKSVVQFWAQCVRGDSGTVDVSIQRSTGLTTVAVVSLNYNGASGWKLFHAVIDADSLSGFDGGLTLVFPVTAGIRYWGQQVASNASAPVPRLPYGIEYPSGGLVIDNQCVTHMGQHYEAKRESNSVGTVLTTQSLVSSADQSGAKSYEVTVVTSFTGTSITEIYHVTLAYGLAATVADCVKLISTSTAGVTSAQRVSVGVSSLTANSAKSLTFIVNTFVNTLQVKVRPLW